MSASIPIANVYYLLCYAWNRLDEGEIIDVSQLPHTHLVDLFTFVLCRGVQHLARRGLEQGYDARDEEISGIRGRLDIANSLRRSLFHQGRACCQYDELSPNTAANQVIKSTLRSLLGIAELERELKDKAYQTCRQMRGVTEIHLSRQAFESVRITSCNKFYKFLLSVSRIIFDSVLIDEKSGHTSFRDFTRDDRKMAGLFQSFLFNFIGRECRQWDVRRENISWRAQSETDPDLTFLPRMQTDISAVRPGIHRIIDAKYYTKTISTYYDSEKFHSANLFQICSYLLNAKVQTGTKIEGMLIYPFVDKKIDQKYELLGFPVRLKTINLDAPWQNIDMEIRQLMQ